MSNVVWVEDAAEFRRILDTNPNVVVDFSAPAWCQPCIRFAPHFDLASTKSEDTKFVAVDVDKSPWAMVEYGVQGVPTVMLYRDGHYVKNLQERTVVKLLAEINS